MFDLASCNSSYSRIRNLRNNQELNNLSLVIKPVLDGNLAAAVIGRQGAERVDALQGANRGGIQRRHAAGLLDPNVERVAVSRYVEGDVDALRGA